MINICTCMCITIIHSGTCINPLKNNRNLYLIKIWANQSIYHRKTREKSLLLLKPYEIWPKITLSSVSFFIHVQVPAVRTCPSITSDTFSPLMPDRPRASLIHMVPRSWAGRVDNPPQKDPSKQIARTHSLIYMTTQH